MKKKNTLVAKEYSEKHECFAKKKNVNVNVNVTQKYTQTFFFSFLAHIFQSLFLFSRVEKYFFLIFFFIVWNLNQQNVMAH